MKRDSKKVLMLLALTVALVVGGQSAQAANLLTNGSFEVGTDPVSQQALTAPDTTTITGWDIYTGGIDYIGTLWQAAQGSRSLDMDGAYVTGGIQQSFLTSVGGVYSVTFAMAGNPLLGFSPIRHLRVSVAGVDNDFTFDITGKTYSDMGWVYHSFNFTATSATTNLQFLSTDASGSAWGPALDDVSVTAITAPLPAATWLLGSGLLGLFGWRRFQKS